MSRISRWGRRFLILDSAQGSMRHARPGRSASARAIAILSGCALASGCASIFEGTTQQISVNTTPPGAQCTFLRNGESIGSIASTPGAATIQKTRDDMVIVCSKRGYASATFVNRSGLAMVAYANILTVGLSWAVDTSRGADNKYQGEVDLALTPLGPASPVESRPLAPDHPPSAPSPPPVPVRQGTAMQAPPAAPPAPVVPAGPQLNCAAPDGSLIRVTGSACPAGWTPSR